MAEEIRKDFETLNDDDLFSVSGGVSGYNRLRPNTGTHMPQENTILSGIAGTKPGSTGASGYIGDTEEGELNPAGLGTVTTNCPRCNMPTVHIVFTGGRGKCTACGLVRDKL